MRVWRQRQWDRWQIERPCQTFSSADKKQILENSLDVWHLPLLHDDIGFTVLLLLPLYLRVFLFPPLAGALSLLLLSLISSQVSLSLVRSLLRLIYPPHLLCFYLVFCLLLLQFMQFLAFFLLPYFFLSSSDSTSSFSTSSSEFRFSFSSSGASWQRSQWML